MKEYPDFFKEDQPQGQLAEILDDGQIYPQSNGCDFSSPGVQYSSINFTTKELFSRIFELEEGFQNKSSDSGRLIFYDYSNDDDTSTGWESIRGGFDTTDPRLFYEGRLCD